MVGGGGGGGLGVFGKGTSIGVWVSIDDEIAWHRILVFFIIILKCKFDLAKRILTKF